MTVLEIIAEQRLGTKNWAQHPGRRAALPRIDNSTRVDEPGEDEKARIASVVELCLAYERETDVDEKANILRTLEEVSDNKPLELSGETLEQWEEKLGSNDSAFSRAKKALDQRRQEFQKKY